MPTTTVFPELLTPNETAEILGVAPATLSVWRCVRRYDLPYCKCGRLVRYKAADVQAFIKSRTKA